MQCIDGKTLDGWRISSTKDGYWAFIEDEKLYIFEWIKYHVEGTNNDLREVLINGKPAKRLKNGLFVVSFGNFVGLSELVLIFENGRTITMPVEVLSSKLSKINPEFFSNLKSQYEWIERLSNVQNAFVDALIGDILQYSQAIPFYLESPTAFSVTESDEPINELFAYHFLRSNKTRIIEAFEMIMHRMKRELRVEEEWPRPNEVDEVTPETLISIAGHPEYLAPAGDGVLVAKYLNGYVPTKVLGSRKYESFDTPENRFAKHFLNILIEWGERVVETFNEKDADLKPIRELLGELEFIRSDSVWEEIGNMTLFPYTSQTLLKGDGYRDLLELYREFTAYSPFFEELQRAIDNKDIATLYEYWCFFRLVKELSGVLGKKSIRIVVTPAGELSESGDVYAQFDNDWRLYYNKRLTSQKWSYSVTLRPDFSLFRNGKLIGVFDAKFKLDVVDEPKEIEDFDKEDEEAERSGNYTTWAKLEDIYKMHAYRDALGCRFAVVLYPGRRSVFFDAKTGKNENISLEAVILNGIEGVGYLSFVPGVME